MIASSPRSHFPVPAPFGCSWDTLVHADERIELVLLRPGERVTPGGIERPNLPPAFWAEYGQTITKPSQIRRASKKIARHYQRVQRARVERELISRQIEAQLAMLDDGWRPKS